MAIPVTKIGQLRVGPLAGARPGTISYFRRSQELFTYLAFGAEGGATQLLIQNAQGELRCYGVPAGGPNALHLDDRGQLRIEIREEVADQRRLVDYVGCLGASPGGFIICAGASGTFRESVPAYFSLQNWEPISLEGQAFFETVWFTNWSLSYLDEAKCLNRVLGSPPWPAGQQLQRA